MISNEDNLLTDRTARGQSEALVQVLVMSPSEAHSTELVAGLELAHVGSAKAFRHVNALAAEYQATGANAIMMHIPADGLDLLDQLLSFAGRAECPIALFLDGRIDVNLGKIIDAGICTVVVDGLAARRIPHLLETTMHRFRKMRGLQIQLEEAQSALEERKQIDRAKGILIKQRAIAEPEAYKLLRRAAMNKNCKISDIARTIIIASEV